jgi:hypothetical protein
MGWGEGGGGGWQGDGFRGGVRHKYVTVTV